MKIALINPYTHFLKYEGSHCFPLGLLAIASSVKDLASIKIIDYNIHDYHTNKLLEKIQNKDIIGISCWMDTSETTQKISNLIKKYHPKKLIVLGGPFVTVAPEICLNNTSADIAVIGEGEKSFRNIVQRKITGNSLHDIPGTIYNNKGNLYHNKKEPDIVLDKYDLDFDLFPDLIKAYMNLGNVSNVMNETIFSFSRGCKNNCRFCGANYLGKYRELPMAKIKKRIQNLLAAVPDIKSIHFVDSNFSPLGNQKKTKELCRFLHSMGITYTILQRADALNKELVEMFKETGCHRIYLGVERLSKELLKISNKSEDVMDIQKGINLITKSGISLSCFIIFGMPGDSEIAIRKTVDYIKSKKAHINPNWLFPIPGTPIFNLALEKGEIQNSWEYFVKFSKQYNQNQRSVGTNLSNVSNNFIKDIIDEIWEYNKTINN